MTTMPTAEPMTAQEFLALPEAQHGRPWNLVAGELVVNEPTLEHQAVAQRLSFALARWIEAGAGRGLAIRPLDVLIDDRNVYAPDVLWYSEPRRPDRRAEPPYPIPDLAVEVRSPSTWRHDIGVKKDGYERGGLPELWLVDTPAAEVLVFRRSRPGAPTFDVSLQLARGDVLQSPFLEGFALPVGRLFAD